MALYDNKFWLLSHIRNSFISTDDTGMSELVMVEEDIPKRVADKLDCYRDPEDSEEDDDMGRPFDMHLEADFVEHRHRLNPAFHLEKFDQNKKRAAKVKHVKWELSPVPASAEELDTLFKRKDIQKDKVHDKSKSLLTEYIQKCSKLPQNPYIEYTKFDGSGQIGIPTRTYKIFLTMLPEQHRNYPMVVCCLASATIEQLIGYILLRCSTVHDFVLKPVTHYGIYITEEDGEVDNDFPNLDPKEILAKFCFTCLGLVEHKQNNKNVNFETTQVVHNELGTEEDSTSSATLTAEEAKQITKNMALMKVHTTTMEASFYQSYTVYIINKMRAKAEIHLGISGEKIEIDPLQQSSKFTLVRQKAVSHPIDSVAWCEITDTKSGATSFRVVYSLSFGSYGNSFEQPQSPLLTSASFKHYDFEADHNTAEEIVQKINLILELRSSVSRKEYMTTRERKQRRKNLHLGK